MENLKVINGGIDILNSFYTTHFLQSGDNQSIYLDVKSIPELGTIYLDKDEKVLKIGSNVSLEELLQYSRENIEFHSLFQNINDCIMRISSVQSRNVCSVVGNVLSKNSVPELLVLFAGIGSKITYVDLMSNTIEENSTSIIDFVDTISVGKIVTEIELPLYDEDVHFVKYIKQSDRYMSDVPQLCAVMDLEFDFEENIIDDCSIIFGGIYENVFSTKNKKICEIYSMSDTCEFLTGKNSDFSSETITKGIEILQNEFESNFGSEVDDSKVNLSSVVLFKMLKSFVSQNYPESVDPRELHYFNYNDCLTSMNRSFTHFDFIQGSSVGKSLPNIYGKDLISGTARFVDDIPPLKDELFCYIIYSKIAKGKLKSVDSSESLKVEGVKAFVDYEDIENLGGTNLYGSQSQGTYDEIFCSGNITCYGQPIGVIVSENYSQARKAAEKLVIDYEVENGIFTIIEAIKNNSFFDFYPIIKNGDVEEGFEKSKHVIEGTFEIGAQDHAYAETQISIVLPRGENDEITIISASQALFGIQKFVANALNVPFHKVVVKTKRLGGAYGGKQTRASILSVINSIAATSVNKSTRLKLGRPEDFQLTGGRHPFLVKYKIGFEDSGKINAIKSEFYSNSGNCNDLSLAIMDKAMLHIDQCYNIENVLYRGYCCKTNIVSPTAFRGFGAPQTQFSMENIIETVSTYLEIDSSDVRSLNMYNYNDKTPYGCTLNDTNLNRVWKRILEKSEYKTRLIETNEFNLANKYKKRGIHIMPAKCGLGMCNAPFYNVGSAVVSVFIDGSVLASTGGVEMGQGINTKICQVVASTLGINFEKVHVQETSTDKTANSPNTAASMGSDVFCGASVDASMQILERLKPIKEEFEENGEEYTWEELVKKAYFSKIDLQAKGFCKLDKVYPMEWSKIEEDWKSSKKLVSKNPFPYWIFGGVCTEVEIDVLSGNFKILKVDIVEDCGSSLNPVIDLGQIEGSFMQGVGWVTNEEMIIGSNDNKGVPGKVYSNSFIKYKVPLASDCPREINVEILEKSYCETGMMGNKTAGEPPFFLGTSVFFAIRNAVMDFRMRELEEEDVNDVLLKSPATAERIRDACGVKFE